MSNLLSRMRIYGLVFVVLSGSLLVIRLGLGQMLLSAPQVGDITLAIQGLDTVLLMVSVAFTLLLVILLYGLLVLGVSWILTQLFRAPALKETLPLHRLFGVLAVAILFSGMIHTLYDVARNMVIGLFSDVPRDMMSSFRAGMGCIETMRVYPGEPLDSNCISGMFIDAGNTIQRVAVNVFGQANLGQLNPVHVILAVALFALVSIIAHNVRLAMGSKGYFWMAYGSVAGFATYLTLSAILAVPLLSENEEVTPKPAEELRAILTQMMAQEDKTLPIQTGEVGTISGLFTEDNLEALGVKLGALPAGASGPVTPDVRQHDVALRSIRRIASEIDGQILRLDPGLRQLQSEMQQSTETKLQAAVLAYESEISVRRGQREASRHFQDLQNWFQRVIDESDRAISRCENRIIASQARYERSKDVIESYLRQGKPDQGRGMTDLLANLPLAVEDEFRFVSDFTRDAYDACDKPQVAAFPMPTRRDYGSYLGVVGFAASWLLSTESMEVTLLTGLIGFGLLGSLVAQFVHSGGKEEFNVAQIATVVFTGFTAAIVVYVAAYGGLAIASVEGSDPNPYVVFGSCLVGAVFSAEIWDRAKKWFITDNA